MVKSIEEIKEHTQKMGPETTKNGPSKEVNDVNQKF